MNIFLALACLSPQTPDSARNDCTVIAAFDTEEAAQRTAIEMTVQVPGLAGHVAILPMPLQLSWSGDELGQQRPILPNSIASCGRPMALNQASRTHGAQ